MRNRKLKGRLDAARQAAVIATAIDATRKARQIRELYEALGRWGKRKEYVARKMCVLLPAAPSEAGFLSMGKGTCSAPIPEGAVAVLDTDSELIYLGNDAQVVGAFRWAGTWRYWFAAEFTPSKDDLPWWGFRPLAEKIRFDGREVAIFGRGA